MPKPRIPLSRPSVEAQTRAPDDSSRAAGRGIAGARGRTSLIGAIGISLPRWGRASRAPMTGAAAMTGAGGQQASSARQPAQQPGSSRSRVVRRMRDFFSARSRSRTPQDTPAAPTGRPVERSPQKPTANIAAGQPGRPAERLPQRSTRVPANSDKGYQDACSLLYSVFDHSDNLYSPDDLVQGELTGGSRFANLAVPAKTVVNIQVRRSKCPTNASFVDAHNIAAQVPMVESRNPQSIPALYASVMDHGVDKIVNLVSNNTLENMFNPAGVPGSQGAALAMSKIAAGGLAPGGADVDLAEINAQYWPDEGHSAKYQLDDRRIQVTTERVEMHSGYQVITLKLQERAQTRAVQLYHYTQWPEAQAPSGADLAQFTTFAQHAGSNPADTVLVQCINGSGRSGTFIVHRQLMAGIRSGAITRENLMPSIRSLIWEGTVARGQPFVRYSSEVEMLISSGLAELDRLSVDAPSATGSAGAARAVQAAETDAPSLGDILHLLRCGQLTTTNKKQMIISSRRWREMIRGLSSFELYQLAVDASAPLGERSGYPRTLTQLAIESYAQLHVPELIRLAGGVEGARARIERNPSLTEGSLAGQVIRKVLASYDRNVQMLRPKEQYVQVSYV